MKRWIAASVMLAGCGPSTEPASTFGREVFQDASLSTSPFNVFSCATCHDVGGSDRINAGYDLAGVTKRSSWWGGNETKLLDAINVCVVEFMGGAPLEEEDTRARELYEFLAETNAATTEPLPLTITRNIIPLSTLHGDATRGKDLYDRTCQRCHGEPHTGAGRITARASIVPEETIAAFQAEARAAVVEKIRHGKFFNIGGVMPPYSQEALSDEQVADILSYLGL